MGTFDGLPITGLPAGRSGVRWLARPRGRGAPRLGARLWAPLRCGRRRSGHRRGCGTPWPRSRLRGRGAPLRSGRLRGCRPRPRRRHRRGRGTPLRSRLRGGGTPVRLRGTPVRGARWRGDPHGTGPLVRLRPLVRLGGSRLRRDGRLGGEPRVGLTRRRGGHPGVGRTGRRRPVGGRWCLVGPVLRRGWRRDARRPLPVVGTGRHNPALLESPSSIRRSRRAVASAAGIPGMLAFDIELAVTSSTVASPNARCRGPASTLASCIRP